jgi:sporulation-control protein spo0M
MRMRSVRGSEIVYRTENEELSLLLEFEYYTRGSMLNEVLLW